MNFSNKISKNKELAEDCLHDTFLYFFGKEEDHGPSPDSYFYQAIQGRFLNSTRVKHNKSTMHFYIDSVSKENDILPKDFYDFEEKHRTEQILLKDDADMQMEYLKSIVGKALVRGSEQYRIFTAVMKGKTIIELSKNSDSAYNTVKANFRHAFLKVKKFVEENPLEY